MFFDILIISSAFIIPFILFFSLKNKEQNFSKIKYSQNKAVMIDARKCSIPEFSFKIVQNKEDMKISNSGTDLDINEIKFEYTDYCKSIVVGGIR